MSVDSFRKFRRFSSIFGFVVKSLGWEMRIGQFWNLEFQWFSLDSAKKCNEIPQKSWKKKVSEKSWCTFCTLWPHFCSFLCFYVFLCLCICPCDFWEFFPDCIASQRKQEGFSCFAEKWFLHCCNSAKSICHGTCKVFFFQFSCASYMPCLCKFIFLALGKT